MRRSHWGLKGPTKARDAGLLFKVRNVAGGHVATFRRIIRIGPFSIMVIRYQPGHIEES